MCAPKFGGNYFSCAKKCLMEHYFQPLKFFFFRGGKERGGWLSAGKYGVKEIGCHGEDDMGIVWF